MPPCPAPQSDESILRPQGEEHWEPGSDGRTGPLLSATPPPPGGLIPTPASAENRPRLSSPTVPPLDSLHPPVPLVTASDLTRVVSRAQSEITTVAMET